MGEFDGPRPGAAADFTGRVVDHFFRRFVMYLLPVALFAAIGIYTAGRQCDEFESVGTLTASTNPLLEPTEIRTTSLNRAEAPAAGSARLINEQMGTDAFVDEVALRAELADSLESGAIGRETIRKRVGARARGQNVLAVEAQWGDPQTALNLVNATIEAYLDYVDEVVTGDSEDAVEFLESQLTDAEERVVTAEDELDAFVQGLPPLLEGERPAEVQLELNRLSDSVREASQTVSETQRQIDQAELAADQAQSAAGRQLRVVDAAELALEPTSSTLVRVATVIVFTMMGVLVSLTALILAVVFDRTVRSQRQLAHVVGTEVVTVPRLSKQDRARHDAATSRKAA